MQAYGIIDDKCDTHEFWRAAIYATCTAVSWCGVFRIFKLRARRSARNSGCLTTFLGPRPRASDHPLHSPARLVHAQDQARTTLTHNSCCSTFCFRNRSKAQGQICSSKISPDGGLMPKGIVLFCLILGCCL